MIRADVELLDSHLSDWPTDKLCFPWRTRYAHLKSPVNDVLFYIPQFLFHDVRAALESPHASVSRDHQNLHWLGDVPALREHIWLQYNFFHPANTERRTNPLYRIGGRETGTDSTGKFVQYDLEQQGETEAKTNVSRTRRRCDPRRGRMSRECGGHSQKGLASDAIST